MVSSDSGDSKLNADNSNASLGAVASENPVSAATFPVSPLLVVAYPQQNQQKEASAKSSRATITSPFS